jgi:hypothetical protein
MAAALVGYGHGDYFYLNRNRLRRERGIKIDSYSKEKPPEYMLGLEYLMFDDSERTDVIADFEEIPVIDGSVLAECDSIQRRYSAVVKGRILPERKPRFIGTWNPGCVPDGLFEMYVRRKNRTGEFGRKIEDCLGTAGFTGKIGAHAVEFTKVYNHGAIHNGGLRYPIEYIGSKENGVYKGTYSAQTASGTFELREFDG